MNGSLPGSAAINPGDVGIVPEEKPAAVRVTTETRVLGGALAVILAVGLISSLFFKPSWLWMDEVLSYQLISDPSLAHANDALVSGMDANPPLFPNLYWVVGHALSLAPQFLRAVSVVFFALTMAIFYGFTTRLVGTARTNLVLVSLIVAFTYLNFTLSTQIRAYAVFILVSCGYFIVVQRLLMSPRRPGWLLGHVALGGLLVLTHNFGLFYLAASGLFAALLYLWGRKPAYGWVLGSYLIIGLIWFVVWYPSFAIQAAAGKPHSWIPLPTFRSFFAVTGELIPSLSSRLERMPLFLVLPVLRCAGVLGLFLWIAGPRLKRGYRATVEDGAFTFYLFSGFVFFATLAISVAVSFLHTSVFISRYVWPSHLLLIFQLVYAFHHLKARYGKRAQLPNRLSAYVSRLLQRAPPALVWSVYFLALGGFVFGQNRKIVVFPHGIVDYLPSLNPAYPIFVETADYFLPIWSQRKEIPVYYLLDWTSASRPDNQLSATVEFKIMRSFAEKYGVPQIVPETGFTPAAFPHFYVVDETSVYGIERWLDTGQVRVLREIPVAIKGHRIIECTFASALPDNASH